MTGHLTPPELHELSDGCLAYVQADGVVRARLASDLRIAKTQPTMTAIEKISHWMAYDKCGP